MRLGKKGSQDVVERFKEGLLDMHRGIPDYYYWDYVEQIVPNQEIRDYMFKKDIFVKSEHKTESGKDKYFLGLNGIHLAQSYRIENLTKVMRRLTDRIFWLTYFLLILGLIQLLAIIHF